MTQHKAAALTSSLFARKGAASPASLLIADLEASGLTRPLNGATKAAANGKVQAQAGDRSGAEGDAGLGIDLGHRQIPVGALNGTAGRRKPAATEPELPLLAFVEAQGAPKDGELSGQRTAPSSAPEPAARPAGEADLPPAASLLDSGAQALRRVNGQVETTPAGADADPFRAHDSDLEAAAEEMATGLGAADPTAFDTTEADLAAPETVSGDDRITAIEDAPDDHSLEKQEGALDAAPQAEAETEAAIEAEAAPDAASEDIAAPAGGEAHSIEARKDVAPAPAASDVEPAEDTVADTAADAVAPPEPAKAVELAVATLSATLALRQAAAQRPDDLVPQATQVAEPALETARAPAERSSVVPWKRAAVVALGLALGLGAYVTLSGTPSDAPVVQPLPATPAPVQEPVQSEVSGQPGQPEAVAAGPADGPGSATAATGEAAAVAPIPSDAAVAAPSPVLPEPSFDIIRIEPNGQSIIAGRAVPLSEWILLNNGEPIASIRADVNGEWVVLPDATLVPGANAFSLVPKAEQGRVAIPAPEAPVTNPGAADSGAADPGAPDPGATVPAGHESPGSMPPGPRSETVSEPSDSRIAFALPKPKPERVLEALRPTAVAVLSAGAYEVQFASVRQSADAERERHRLVKTFPGLLGSLELRVQEASVEGAGTFYRVRSGALEDIGSARDVCRQLEAANQGCLVVRRAPQQVTPEAQTDLVLEPVAPPKRPAARQQAERPR